MIRHGIIKTVNPGFGGQSFIPSMMRKLQPEGNIDERQLKVDIQAMEDFT